MTTLTRRRKRLERKPGGGLLLNAHSVEILRLLYEHRFLDTRHFAALLGVSERVARYRLLKLFDHGYVDRPRQQFVRFDLGTGSRKLVSAVSRKGVSLLRERGLVMDGEHLDWSAKNREVKREHIEHTLLIADVYASFAAACRNHERARFIEPAEILSGMAEEARHREKPFDFRVPLVYGGKAYTLPVSPDKVFGIAFKQHDGSEFKTCFLLEADRATMPALRTSLTQTSVYRKFLAYHEALQTRELMRRYNLPSVLILTVTTSRARTLNLIETQKKAKAMLRSEAAPGFFLFAHQEEIAPETVLTHDWLIGNGETRRLKMAYANSGTRLP